MFRSATSSTPTLRDVHHDAVRILREDSPELADLLAQGWRVVSSSWGARLTLSDDADLTIYRQAVTSAQQAGYEVRTVSPAEVGALASLDLALAPDFPATPASRHEPLPLDLADRLTSGSWLAFGAWAGTELVAFTILYRFEGRWEVDRTAVRAPHRRRGLATAVKAASILTTYAQGARRWGTGGAAANTGSLAMNRALNFTIEEAWHTVHPPPNPS